MALKRLWGVERKDVHNLLIPHDHDPPMTCWPADIKGHP